MVQKEDIIKNNLVSILTKKGKKNKVTKIYNNLIINLKKNIKKNPTDSLQKIVKNVKPLVEVKKISKYKSIVLFMKSKKRLNTSIRWLTESLKLKHKTKYKKLNDEFINSYRKNSFSESLKKKKEIYKQSQKLKFNFKKK